MRVAILLTACLLLGCTRAQPMPQGSAVKESAVKESVAAVAYDLGREFSFTANPNGPWRYGYTTGAELTRGAFAPMAVVEQAPPVAFWHPGQGREGYYPYIAAAAQDRATTATDQTGSWTLRPGEIALEAANTGQYAVIEFTVPAAGQFAISAEFTGIHKGRSTTDAHVLLGDESLFKADVSGAGQAASYRETRTLKAGDVLTFAVGYGANRTHYNDTTGLILTIRTG